MISASGGRAADAVTCQTSKRLVPTFTGNQMSPIPQVLRRHPLAITLVVLIGLPVLIFTLWAGITLNYTYSSGERAGYLQKISKRGWLCKTWEGEIQLSAIPGSAPETFYFTTRSDSIAQVLNRYNGQRVVVDYKQHKGVPGTCFGETEYFISGVRLVGGANP